MTLLAVRCVWWEDRAGVLQRQGYMADRAEGFDGAIGASKGFAPKYHDDLWFAIGVARRNYAQVQNLLVVWHRS